MPIAALATDLIVNGKVIYPAGTELTALETYELERTYQQPVKFRCLSCSVSLVFVRGEMSQELGKRSPHFRSYPDRKGEHHDPCPFAGEGEQDGASIGEIEVVADKWKIPTKLIKRTRNSFRAPAITSEPLSSVPEGHRTLRHQEHTSAVVKDFCIVYLDRIKDYPDPRDHGIALQRLRLFLPGSSRNLGYAKAFQYVSGRFRPTYYQIFYGTAKEVVKCCDGYIISYKIPGKYNDTWKPVVAHLPMDILDEFDQRPYIDRMLTCHQITKNPWAFLCGCLKQDGQGILIILESSYWIHCTKHSCWSNQHYVRVSEVSQPTYEVLPLLFAKRRNEYHRKFPLREGVHSGGANNAETLPQRESPISRADLSLPALLTPSVSPPAVQQELPEQSSSSPTTATNQALPKQEPAHNNTRQPLWKRVITNIKWPWKRL
jgi:hypothetical protein